MLNASRVATEEACYRPAQDDEDMGTVIRRVGSGEGRQRARVTSRPTREADTDDTEANGRTTSGSGRRRARNDFCRRTSPNRYWYLSAVAAMSAAFFAIYVSLMTLQNLSILLKEVRAARGTQQEALDDGRSQQSDVSLSMDVSPGETYEEGEEASCASEIQTPVTQHHDQSSSTEVSQRGLLGIIIQLIVKTVLLYVHSIMYAVVKCFRFAVLIFEGVRSFVSGIVAIGNTVQMLASVLFTAVSVSVVILGLHLIVFLLSATFPEGHIHASLHSVFGQAAVLLFRFLQWFPYASLLFSSFLLAVYRTVAQASTRDTVSRGLGVLFAYFASLSISEMLSIPHSDPTWGVSLSTLSYFTALSTFLTVDSLRQWSTRPFMLGLLTLYTMYLISGPLISAALQRPWTG